MAKDKKPDPEAPPLPEQFKPWMLDALHTLDEVLKHVLKEAETWMPGPDTDHAPYVDELFDALHKMQRRVKDARKAANKLP